MVSKLGPVFPCELEREIFETAAEVHADSIPSLLLVASRVHTWIEPLNYRTFILARPANTCPRFRLLEQGIKKKSADFIRDNVRHLFAKSAVRAAPLNEILAACTGIRFFVMFNPDWKTLSRIQDARPHRLATSILKLLGDAPSSSVLPVFSALTHLHIFDESRAISAKDAWSTLGQLPALTHLAMFRISHAFEIREILGQCKSIQVLIGLWCDEDQWNYGVDRIHTEEARFVSMVLDPKAYAEEWQIGIRDGVDFWATAEAFIAKKRHGDIPKTRHWIIPEDGVRVSDGALKDSYGSLSLRGPRP